VTAQQRVQWVYPQHGTGILDAGTYSHRYASDTRVFRNE
jgi:hypothetical protein